ncbi:methyltransferase domain-containing protein [Streptomyces sp. NBC_00250]|uniref:methyltransferase domain-containing protein n=1 Tax=Streptomyces sp. NBC_00250 TaxID=2903641 RepID=UPI003FA76F1A
MRLRPGGRALDLGCGTGRVMPALRAQVGPTGRVMGIDVTPAMPASAARQVRGRRRPLPRPGRTPWMIDVYDRPRLSVPPIRGTTFA